MNCSRYVIFERSIFSSGSFLLSACCTLGADINSLRIRTTWVGDFFEDYFIKDLAKICRDNDVDLKTFVSLEIIVWHPTDLILRVGSCQASSSQNNADIDAQINELKVVIRADLSIQVYAVKTHAGNAYLQYRERLEQAWSFHLPNLKQSAAGDFHFRSKLVTWRVEELFGVPKNLRANF